MIHPNKRADEIAGLYGLQLGDRKFHMQNETEWQVIREQVHARIPYGGVLDWLDNEVRPRVVFEV